MFAAVYVGETSRSPYQRGKEHQEEVDLTKKVHPLVIHFQEVHNEEKQAILMSRSKPSLRTRSCRRSTLTYELHATCSSRHLMHTTSATMAFGKQFPKPSVGLSSFNSSLHFLITDVRDSMTGSRRACIFNLNALYFNS